MATKKKKNRIELIQQKHNNDLKQIVLEMIKVNSNTTPSLGGLLPSVSSINKRKLTKSQKDALAKGRQKLAQMRESNKE